MAKDHEAVKKHIRDIAVGVFLEHGYKGATMRSIAKSCDMPLATLQYYYSKKIEIFNDIVTPMIANTALLLYKLTNPAIKDGGVDPAYIEELVAAMEEHIVNFRQALILTMRESRGTPYENRSQELLGQLQQQIPLIMERMRGQKPIMDEYKKAYTSIIAEMSIDLMVAVARRYEPKAWVHDILYEGIMYSYRSLEQLSRR
jgi:AcrR family transcriptional regulator